MEVQLWRELLEPYRLAVDELVVKFDHIIQEYHDAEIYCPIEQVRGRVKKISSILEKCQRKGVELEELEERIEDIAGIRLICQFVEDIERVYRRLLNIAQTGKTGERYLHMGQRSNCKEVL